MSAFLSQVTVEEAGKARYDSFKTKKMKKCTWTTKGTDRQRGGVPKRNEKEDKKRMEEKRREKNTRKNTCMLSGPLLKFVSLDNVLQKHQSSTERSAFAARISH